MSKGETFLKHLQNQELLYSVVIYFFLYVIPIWAMISFPKFPATLFCEI